MPFILKTLNLSLRTAILCAALLWNGGALQAQDEDSPRDKVPRRKLTREEAAEEFAIFLAVESGAQPYFYSPRRQESFNGGISHKSEVALGDKWPDLVKQLAAQWKRPSQIVKVQSEGNKTAIVVVEDDPVLPNRPFSLIEENGSWGVDLVETYAKWNNLEGTAKAQAIYDILGIALTDLPRSEKMNRGNCQSNLKRISLALQQYTQDNDEQFPPAKQWQEALKPYLTNEDKAILDCPSLPTGQHNGYAYNSKMSTKSEGMLGSSSETASFYETTILKPNAYGLGENRALRHDGGSNYAFADGHVKWFDKSQTPSFKLSP